MSATAFDFDQWAALAKVDMAEFERQRVAALDAVCERMGGKELPRLAAVRWRIEAEISLRHARDPLHQRLFGLMWKSCLDLDAVLHRTLGSEPDRQLPASEQVLLLLRKS